VKVCTSEARKTGETLAPRQGEALSGLSSLWVRDSAHDFQGRRCGQERGRYETRGSSRSGKGLTIRLSDLRIFDPQIVWPFYLA
jgi:hypothetical protein